MAKEQDAKLFHVLVLTSDEYALLVEAVQAQRKAAHDDAHHVDEEDDDHAELCETAAHYDDLSAALLNGWDVHEDNKGNLHASLNFLQHEA